ncbi:MAG: response regulator [Verrucomicrobia bacterium]|nr:response regulator [Verrucomicrobiota bacterium]
MPEIIQSICILDDDSSVLSSLQQLLDSDGFAARTFDNPDRFLAYAQEHAVTLVLLDVWMPGTNGIEVQERLHEFSPGTRVIVMTGREEARVRDAAMESGAFAFLVKPFDDEAFLTLVHSAVDGGS